MNASLHIVYESNAGRPLTAAKVRDQRLLVETAKTAIQEAFERAESVREMDEFLGHVQKEEAERLRKVLEIMVPELKQEKQRRGRKHAWTDGPR